jgi:signal transduction histidine kinase
VTKILQSSKLHGINPVRNPPLTHPETPIIDVIASGVHDTKNVLFDALTRIGFVADQLRAGNTGEVPAMLDEARLAVELAAGRLSTLLSAYRLERLDNPVSLLPVVVADLLEEAILRFAPADRIAHLQIERSCAWPGLWVMDRELIGDALVNALQNASRHARAHIRVSAEVADGFLRLAVEDDGEGFPASQLHGEGAGRTGLFVTRRILSLHHHDGRSGELILENSSTLGGALFTMRLPG